MEPNLEALCRRLGYQFNNLAILKQSLSHCSVGPLNNERLEFVGDAILSFVIATRLYEQFPHLTEGQLSRSRAFLVKGDTLAEIALEINLGDYLYLGSGELRSGGFRRESILADTLEAIFAAVYLDGGLQASQTLILNLYESRLNDKNLQKNLKDPKTLLQEYLQSEKIALPDYLLLKIEGEEHNQTFFVRCKIKELAIEADGAGQSRRKAEQEAAAAIINLLKHKNA